MEQVIDWIEEQCIMQELNDNGPQHKATRDILLIWRTHIFQTPSATHYIDLMLMEYIG